MIRFTVDSDISQIENQVRRAASAAQHAFDDQVLKDSNYYIPMDSQTLERSSFINSKIGEGLLVWSTPYARRIYYGEGYNFSKDKNPNARALWFEHAKSVHLNSWKTLYERLLEENM